ncbi:MULTISPECIES: hypothetical protein [Acinetobacter calcoaceticus/baumannii complex]|uniref:hypothetical protein n=1 Tax=Acinetobacter calcoaceticus/baumannii complex TaxID=909768 RepID=UPI0023426351|nr:hypothetical protein [Acinetobacter baumannii]
MKQGQRRFTNNIRTIFFIVLIISCLAFYIFQYFNIKPPISFLFFTMAMAAPITALGVSLNGMLSIKKVKDISSSERRRLVYIANRKARDLKVCIIFYTIFAIAANVINSFQIDDSIRLYITVAMLGMIVAAIYSVIISFSDNKQLSDFEAFLQDRANTEAVATKFQSGKTKK